MQRSSSLASAELRSPVDLPAMRSMYEDGKDARKDREEAKRWDRKSAARGNQDAKKALKRLDGK
jgi:TPR repeat protein